MLGLNKMIFDKFFTPKYKHKNADVRLEAISSLDVDKPTDKQRLHELAFNDSSPKVIIGALTALDSFALWVKASETSEHKSVKNRALEKVTEELQNPNSKLISESEFITFCAELKSHVLLEKLLMSNIRLQTQDDLVLSSLKKLDKDNVTRLYFKQCANEVQQLAIVDFTDIAGELNKLAKSTNISAVKEKILTKLNQLREAQRKPEQIKQQASLVTSKLLASKELSDYSMLLQTQTELTEAFELLKSEFSFLNNEDAYEIAGKFLTVNESVEKRLQDLKVEWEQNKALSATTDDIAEIEGQINEVVAQINALSLEQDANALSSQTKLLNNALQDASSSLVSVEHKPKTVAHQRWIKGLLIELDKQQKRLSNLPATLELNLKAHHIIEQIQTHLTTLVQAKENKDYWNESLSAVREELKLLKDAWKSEVLSAEFNASNTILSEWETLMRQLNGLLKELSANQEKQKKQALNKLKTVQRMIEQGKFKSAIASFEYAKKHLQAMPELARQQLEYIYTEVAEEVLKLQELQAFIAAPRKPALIEEALLLSQTDMSDVAQRIATVKKLRAQWNSLGVLNTPEDTVLNEQFDEYIESAFKPCREHFVKQDEIRKVNKVLGLELLDEAAALSTIDDTAALAKSLVSVQNRWRKLGQLESTDYKKLQSEFKKVINPLQVKVAQFHELNAEAKLKLCRTAEALSMQDDVKDAVQKAKTLQADWKSIGYAGNKQDDRLWKQFRAFNDAVFAKLKSLNAADKQADDAAIKSVDSQLTELQDALQNANSAKELSELETKVSSIQTDLSVLPSSRRRSYTQRADKLTEDIKAKTTQLLTQAAESEYIKLFAVLSKWTSESLSSNDLPDISELSNKQQARFKQDISTTKSRRDITIEAEVLSQTQSIKADAKRRKEIQLQMMASKLGGETVDNLEQLLSLWVSHGALQEGDLALLKRMKRLFVSGTNKQLSNINT